MSSETREDVPAVPAVTPNAFGLMDRLLAFIASYVAMSPPQLTAVAVWVVHTHCFAAADSTPYLSVTSATKRCGKSRLLEVLSLLVSRPWLTSRVSAAVLVRKVDAEQPTLLLDENDTAFNGPGEYSEALRGVLNSGNRRAGRTSVCVVRGADITFRDFGTFCPKALAGIGHLPDTIADRSIPILLQRRRPTEKVERFRQRDVLPRAVALREELSSWGSQYLDSLREARPSLPDCLCDRQQDGVEPLLAIADLVGGDWPAKIRAALVALLTASSVIEESIGVRLLSDIRNIFERLDVDRISSKQLAQELADDETTPWAEWKPGRPLTKINLASLLKPFRIGPRTIKLSAGNTAKGYLRDLFEEAWSRYLPASTRSDGSIMAPEASPSSPFSVHKGVGRNSERSAETVVTLHEIAE